jgi:hypothetical protein
MEYLILIFYFKRQCQRDDLLSLSETLETQERFGLLLIANAHIEH